ncbi:MAG: DegV family protein [Atopobiaceae bacterium]|nr:DegV family protein [Atopobiaceae bacterium]
MAHSSNCTIIVDSCGDFNPDVVKRLGVEMIKFPYVMGGEEYLDDLWRSTTPHAFYEAVRNGERITTSAITPGHYLEFFEEAAHEGTPTIYLGFTGGLSSSIHAAERAADIIRMNYPGFEIYVLDNLCPSGSTQLLTIEAVRRVEQGASAAEVYEWAKEARYFVQGFFVLEGFDALAAGGRIPAAAASVGSMLDLKPELSYDLDGSLTLRGMCRGRRKSLRAIINDFREYYLHDTSLPVGIVTADAEKDGDWIEEQVRKEPGCADLRVIRSTLDPVIGSHTGPGMVGLCFWGRDRRENVSLTDRIARRMRGNG